MNYEYLLYVIAVLAKTGAAMPQEFAESGSVDPTTGLPAEDCDDPIPPVDEEDCEDEDVAVSDDEDCEDEEVTVSDDEDELAGDEIAGESGEDVDEFAGESDEAADEFASGSGEGSLDSGDAGTPAAGSPASGPDGAVDDQDVTGGPDDVTGGAEPVDSGAGQDAEPSAVFASAPGFKCGRIEGVQTFCPTGCCSSAGFCGTTEAHCDPESTNAKWNSAEEGGEIPEDIVDPAAEGDADQDPAEVVEDVPAGDAPPAAPPAGTDDSAAGTDEVDDATSGEPEEADDDDATEEQAGSGAVFSSGVDGFKCGRIEGLQKFCRTGCCSSAGFCGTTKLHCDPESTNAKWNSAEEGGQVPDDIVDEAQEGGEDEAQEGGEGEILPIFPEPELEGKQIGNFQDADGITNMCRTPGTVAITFDDGPHPEHTPQLLAIAKEKDIKLTFFWTGDNMEKHGDIVQQAFSDGHQIAIHSMTHADLTTLEANELGVEVNEPNNVLEGIIGSKSAMFRAPFQATNATVNAAIEDGGYNHIFWNIDTKDFEHNDPELTLASWAQMEDDTASNAYIGLQHDILEESPQVLEQVIALVEEKGYQMTTVADCTGLPDYQ